MNSKLLLIAFSITAISSCTTAYKTGQTPDDVYYSPVRLYGEEDDSKKDRDKNEYRNTASNDDRQIRMAIYDRRWRYFDNDFYYSPYNYGYSCGYYYNPFYYTYPVYNPVVVVASNPKVTTPRTVNLGGYGNGYNNNNNSALTSKTGTYNPPINRGYNNSNTSSNRGSKLGNVLNGIINNKNSNSSSNNSSNGSNRTYSPSSSGSSSGSSSSGSSSGGSRPARSGGRG